MVTAIHSLQIIFVCLAVVRLSSAVECFEAIKADPIQFPLHCQLADKMLEFDKELGRGTFGKVLRCAGEYVGDVVKFMANTPAQFVATDGKVKYSYSQNEAKITEYLYSITGQRPVTTVKYRGYVPNHRYVPFTMEAEGALMLSLYPDGDAYAYFKAHRKELRNLSQPLKQKMVKDFLDQMVEIMPIIWNAGVILRDLKLANFLVTRKPGGAVYELMWTVADLGTAIHKNKAAELMSMWSASGVRFTMDQIKENVEAYIHYGTHYSFIDVQLLFDLCDATAATPTREFDTLMRRKLESLEADDLLDIWKTAVNLLGLLNGDTASDENRIIQAFAGYEVEQQRTMAKWVNGRTSLRQYNDGTDIVSVLIEYGTLAVAMADPDGVPELDRDRALTWGGWTWRGIIKPKLTWDGLRRALAQVAPMIQSGELDAQTAAAASPPGWRMLTPGRPGSGEASVGTSVGAPAITVEEIGEWTQTPDARESKLMERIDPSILTRRAFTA